MLNLSGSINVMPMSIFRFLELCPLKSIGIVIQLANKSNAYPIGVIEDGLIRVQELIFPVDFYILEMEAEITSNVVFLILGRPFLKTTRTEIDIHVGTPFMEFSDSIM